MLVMIGGKLLEDVMLWYYTLYEISSFGGLML